MVVIDAVHGYGEMHSFGTAKLFAVALSLCTFQAEKVKSPAEPLEAETVGFNNVLSPW